MGYDVYGAVKAQLVYTVLCTYEINIHTKFLSKTTEEIFWQTEDKA
jgi:hypothetical protein